MKGILGNHKVTQVAFIVRDISEAKKRFAAFLGQEEPGAEDCGDFAVTRTEYLGQPAPGANSLLAFLDGGDGLQIELIQPNEAPSVWRDFLNEHGEGLHHIAFQVKGMDESIQNCEAFGMKLLQRGEYGSGNGRYAYLDASDTLKCVVELLEND